MIDEFWRWVWVCLVFILALLLDILEIRYYSITSRRKHKVNQEEREGRLYQKKKMFFAWSILPYNLLCWFTSNEYLKILYCIRCLMCGFAFCNKLVGWSEPFPNLIIMFVYPAIYAVHIGKISCSMPLFRKLGSCNSVIWIKFTFRKLSAAISTTNKLA